MSQDEVFCPDIWQHILVHVGSPTGASLYPFLSVSHQMYHLALPLFYEDIQIVTPRLHDRLCYDDREVTHKVTHLLNRLLRLSDTLTKKGNKHRIASRSKRFHLKEPDFGIHSPNGAFLNILSDILARLINLKCLLLELVTGRETRYNLLSAVPSSTTLTHLSLRGRLIAEGTRQLLVSQPSLRFLDISDTLGLPYDLGIPADALPELHTFIGHACYWPQIIHGRRVIHLDGHINYEAGFHEPAHTFRNIRTLNVLCANAVVLSWVAEYLKNVKCLSVTITGRQGTITVDDLSSIPSRKLHYLRLTACWFGDPLDELAKSLFHTFPSLNLIDFHKYSLQNVYKDGISPDRYTRSDETAPTKPIVPIEQPWESWWNPTRDAIESAYRLVTTQVLGKLPLDKDSGPQAK